MFKEFRAYTFATKLSSYGLSALAAGKMSSRAKNGGGGGQNGGGGGGGGGGGQNGGGEK